MIWLGEGRTLDFKHKEVINICNGRKLGYVTDVEACFEDGRINAIVVPGSSKRIGLFNTNDIVIAWSDIKLIGEDVILVEIHQ